MKSVKYITAAYDQLKVMYGNEKPAGKNSYRCTQCDYETITNDIDAGVTPFVIQCPRCKGNSLSSFYRKDEIIKNSEPEMEWYRPTLKEALKLRKKNEDLLEHVLMGGLLMRKIK